MAERRDINRLVAIPIDTMPGCELLINDRLGMRVRHPECDTLGYINVSTDVIYCLRCDFKAKPSEVWPASPEPTVSERPSWHQLKL